MLELLTIIAIVAIGPWVLAFACYKFFARPPKWYNKSEIEEWDDDE